MTALNGDLLLELPATVTASKLVGIGSQGAGLTDLVEARSTPRGLGTDTAGVVLLAMPQ